MDLKNYIYSLSTIRLTNTRIVKNLITRSISGIVFIGIVIGSILLGQYTFTALMLVLSIIGLLEFVKMAQKYLSSSKDLVILLLSGILCFVLIATVGASWIETKYLVLIIAVFLIPFIYTLFSTLKNPLEQLSLISLGVLYISVPFALFTSFFTLNPTQIVSTQLLIAFFIMVWCNDVFAYVVGSLIGKHKLYQKVSPNKTWEGTIGGLIFTMLAAFIISKFFEVYDLNTWLVLGFIISIFASLGDLIESMIKRQVGVKDSGSIMPGHGGVLDRFDGVIFAIPAVYIYLSLV
jgi:phosphatidate cytidylyltransferase